MNKSDSNNKINSNVANSNVKKKKKKSKQKNKGKAININNNVNVIKKENANLTKTKKKKKKKKVSTTILPNIVVIDDSNKKNEVKIEDHKDNISQKEIVIIDDEKSIDDTSTLTDSSLNENIEFVDLGNEKETSFIENISNVEVIDEEIEFVSLEKESSENEDTESLSLNNSIIEENINNIEVINDEIEDASLKENIEDKENDSSKVIDNKEKKHNKKDKKRIIIILIIIIIIFVAIFSYIGHWYYKKYIVSPIPVINDVTLNDNTLIIKFDVPNYKKKKNIYCMFKTDDKKPTASEEGWILSKNNECSTTITDGTFYAYLKNEDNIIYDVKKASTIGKVVKFSLNKEQVYVAINGEYSLKFTLETIGNVDKTINWYSEDDTIAKVDQDGKITGVKKGNTIIHAKVMDTDITTKVMVTDLITVRPKKFNNKKSYLPCGKYNEKENDILDAILKDRIEDAGYKTRAGAVEAARFLALEFPYKIRYFSENGRGATNGVDGEGRYYHIGLYLDESRFDKIGKTMMGPKTWGCDLYSRPSKGLRNNGLDCSGFVSWVMLNGGFDVGDIGAGLAPHLDLTDYGKRIRFNADVVSSGEVKVGDLLSSGGLEGGHIAIIVGEDKDYYYVAESLWTPPNVAVVIIGYSKKTIWERYFYVMLMDSYYKEDGNLTTLWY